MEIAYRNLAYYLTPASTFLDARDGAEQAAIDLFGMCSEEHMQTIHAWYAVGVGPQQSALQPEAFYTSANDFACAAPLSTQFFADGNYASYSWDFGDGATSILQNPTHTYTTDGYFTVTLIVSNNNTCQEPDTLIVTDGVVIDEIDPVAGFTTQGPVVQGSPVSFVDTSLYGPLSWEWSFGDGGTSVLQNPSHIFADTGYQAVQLIVHNCHGTDTIVRQVHVEPYLLLCETTFTDRPNGIIFDSGGPDGDYSSYENCFAIISPCNASSITLTFEEFNLADEEDYLYLDDFATGMPLGFFTGNTLPPPITAYTHTLRLTFSSGAQNEQSGFKISYTAELDDPAGTGTTQFIAYPPAGIAGQEVQFIEDSDDPVVAWSWSFGDGGTSDAPYPVHTYILPGTYEVTLTATYCDGATDAMTMLYYVGSVGLEELPGQILVVAPNPFGESFAIRPGMAIGNVGLRILDMSGREVYRNNANEISAQGMTFDAGWLSTGQYLLEVGYTLNGAEAVERHRIQVQR
jgi:PKD repeat protein